MPNAGIVGAGAGSVNLVAAIGFASNPTAVTRTVISGESVAASGILIANRDDQFSSLGIFHRLRTNRVTAQRTIRAANGDSIVWGTNGDSIVWGTSIVWGAATGDSIVWGANTNGDSIVWGTSAGDSIVWGTSAGDSIVWGAADLF
jgi:hypothetical protein